MILPAKIFLRSVTRRFLLPKYFPPLSDQEISFAKIFSSAQDWVILLTEIFSSTQLPDAEHKLKYFPGSTLRQRLGSILYPNINVKELVLLQSTHSEIESF